MKIILARHGETFANEQRRFESSDNESGTSLTMAGVRQVEALALNLKAYRPISNVFSSPARRTRETTRILADALGAPTHFIDDLREIDCGKWAGKSVDAVADRHPRLWKTRKQKPMEFRFPGGENLLEVEQRASSLIESLSKLRPDMNLLLVSHSTMISVLLARLCHWDLEESWMQRLGYHANADFSVLECDLQTGEYEWITRAGCHGI